jgi:hypothetical protein
VPIFGIGLSTIVAVFFAVHAIKNNQDRYWIYLLFMFPIVGCIAYFLICYLPTLRHTRAGFQIESRLRKAIEPKRELREAQNQYDLSQTVDAQVRLAKALVDNNRAHDALTYYQQALSGIYKTAPDILLQYAYALYQDQQFNQAKQTLDFLRETNPNYSSDEGHLLYTKVLVSLNQVEQAKKEFQALIDYYPSFEAISYYLQTLINWNELDKANSVLQIIDNRLKHLPKHSKQLNNQWIKEINQSRQKLRKIND